MFSNKFLIFLTSNSRYFIFPQLFPINPQLADLADKKTAFSEKFFFCYPNEIILVTI
jgi:hypothetical protein